MNITLIIPVYNVEKYLKQCLESVVNQTKSFDEVILINDGSTDDSLSICKEYTSNYSYFKLIDQENKGLSIVRNIGIKYASNEYIMFLDSDDYLSLDCVKILKDKLQNTQYDAVFFDASIYDENNNSVSNNPYDRSKAKLDGYMSGWEYFVKSYPEYYIVQVCMAIYKKSTIIDAKIQFPEGLYYEDNYFTFVFLNHSKKVIHIADKLYQRRYHNSSIMGSKYSERKFVDFIKITILLWERISQLEEAILLKQKELIFEFVSNYFKINLDNYKRCLICDIKLREESKYILIEMIRGYISIVELLKLDLNKVKFRFLNILLNNFYLIYDKGIINKGYIEQKIKEVVKTEKILYYNLLKKLPLNTKDFKVGIYGIGKHTDGLLAVYEKMFGKITCDLLFLDSYKDNIEYKGIKVINYQKVEDNVDLIVISSYLYRHIMIDNLKKYGIDKKISIYTLYDGLECDVFSEVDIFLDYY